MPSACASGRATRSLRVPKGGRVSASVTLPSNRNTGAGPFTTILTGDMRVRRAGRVRRAARADPGRRAGARQSASALRTKVVVAYFPRRASLELLMRSARF